jgi:trk system potassium uptake protein TrkH
MNYGLISKSLGLLLYIEAACMIPSYAAAVIYCGGDASSFLLSISAASAAAFALRLGKPARADIYAKDGYAIVGLGWLLVSAFGAMPFAASGAIPHPVDAFFESMSGFTTTGASILRDVESLPKGILFWRSFTHWVGGMGVLVLMLAVLPSAGANTLYIMQAESTGPCMDKFVPKVGSAAKILYAIYASITLAQVAVLRFGGMPLYDALLHAFGTVGTGGFSDKNASVAAFGSVYIEVAITAFMMLSGVNFALYHSLLRRNWRAVARDEELRFYCAVVLFATLGVAANIYLADVYESIGEALRYASFQVVSVVTTTGFSTADFNAWPTFSQCVLLLLMLVGANAGSTSGGMKCVRVVLLAKIAKREFVRLTHPSSVNVVKLNGRAVDKETLVGVPAFFFLYIATAAAATLLVSLDGSDLVTSATAVLTCLGNIGPGLGSVGPMGNYADFSSACKIALSLCMAIGRLEIYPLMLLCAPGFWRRGIA